MMEVPRGGCGWLWKWDDGPARWRQVWCSLQGGALLCFEEVHSEADDAVSHSEGDGDGPPPGTPPPATAVGASSGSGSTPRNTTARAVGGGAWGAGGGMASRPMGVSIEQPAFVLWPTAVSASSDSVDAPSTHTLQVVSALSGRRHRLCTNTDTQLHAWLQLLQAAAAHAAAAPNAAAGPLQAGMGGGGGGGGGHCGFAHGDVATTPVARPGVVTLPSPDTTHPPSVPRGLSELSELGRSLATEYASDDDGSARADSPQASLRAPQPRTPFQRLDVRLM